MRLSKINSLLSVAALAWLGAGCMTNKLWNDGSMVHSHFPAIPPNLTIYRAEHGDDLLVEYDEACDYNESLVRRAYWLMANQGRIQEKQKPHFVSLSTDKNLQTIPVHLAGCQGSGGALPCAYCSTNGATLTVVFENAHEEDYELPRYADSTGATKKVLLTPLAVATDATVVGAAVGAVVGAYWWAGLGSGGYSIPSK